MDFQQLLSDPFLQTPKLEIYQNDILDYIKSAFNEYRSKLNTLKSEHKIIPRVNYKPRYVQTYVDILINGLEECIAVYLDGKTNKAYQILHETLNHDVKAFYQIIHQITIDSGENFYRIRKKKDNYLLSPEEMFHIPYELRGCVRNQRFSINGFPSLYLSGNLYTCWEELHRPDLSDFQAIRYKNTRDISVLDLTPPDLSEIYTRENYRYILIWPIIFACSIKVKYTSDIFKPEYIIPQLLLQWVRENDDIDCIRYFSTNIERYNSKTKGDFSNYVFPVKETAKTGYCPQLKRLFRHTQPISWQTYHMATGGQEHIYLENEFETIDSKISHLEIIKDRAYPYSNSILGRLEYYLDNMTTQKISF